jgi:hypothetical protein
MRSFLDRGNPYQHALGVSIVRTDTCSAFLEERVKAGGGLVSIVRTDACSLVVDAARVKCYFVGTTRMQF